MPADTEPTALLPLSVPVYHVLLALGDEALHGYAIMQAFERKTRGRETILPGTLYATIGRMVAAGLIEELSEPPAGSTDSRRRYYEVTEFGRAVAAAETERMARLVAMARDERFAVEAGGGR